MAKFSYTYLLLLIVVFSVNSMAMAVAAQADAQKRCQKILYPRGCTLMDCRKKCFQKFGSVGGQCIPTNQAQTIYECLCVYNCHR
ncbi:S locus-related glycoprotein 1 binding pollen coat [Corchorus capsularis]|uniref:S locus-related glycoprotein 1 binding pollen coat n=1 Tax=Corchorus capsularis TaxID=210143 RepID=A0A1R3G6W7_COCAP|nr:S locus-related glycoprotein 1 binding pollen coat [Corchorus capsularis]